MKKIILAAAMSVFSLQVLAEKCQSEISFSDGLVRSKFSINLTDHPQTFSKVEQILKEEGFVFWTPGAGLFLVENAKDAIFGDDILNLAYNDELGSEPGVLEFRQALGEQNPLFQSKVSEEICSIGTSKGQAPDRFAEMLLKHKDSMDGIVVKTVEDRFGNGVSRHPMVSLDGIIGCSFLSEMTFCRRMEKQ